MCSVNFSRTKGQFLLPDHSFDIVLTNNTIDHVKDCDEFLWEVRRLLKPGGVLLFCVHLIEDIFRISRSLVKKVDVNHPHHFLEREVEDLFERCGYRINSRVRVPLYKEEVIPAEASPLKKFIYLTGFFSSSFRWIAFYRD